MGLSTYVHSRLEIELWEADGCPMDFGRANFPQHDLRKISHVGAMLLPHTAALAMHG